jgi:hypothetical protein
MIKPFSNILPRKARKMPTTLGAGIMRYRHKWRQETVSQEFSSKATLVVRKMTPEERAKYMK